MLKLPRTYPGARVTCNVLRYIRLLVQSTISAKLTLERDLDAPGEKNNIYEPDG